MMRLLISAGDPLGVGPFTIALAWQNLPSHLREKILIFGEWHSLFSAFLRVGVELPARSLVIVANEKVLNDAAAAKVSAMALEAAVKMLRSGKAEALVTAPVNKKRLQKIWRGFLGQTEWLGYQFSCRPVMAFMPPAWKRIKGPVIFLMTTHVPLCGVRNLVVKERLYYVLDKALAHLKFIGVENPRLAVLSLDPHVGEYGAIGNADLKIRRYLDGYLGGARVEGPLSADSFFSGRHLGYDGVVAMYHDQGLIPAKMMWGIEAVNVTLGLPIVRTSPGHGTAEDLQVKDVDASGMMAAIRVALEILKLGKN